MVTLFFMFLYSLGICICCTPSRGVCPNDWPEWMCTCGHLWWTASAITSWVSTPGQCWADVPYISPTFIHWWAMPLITGQGPMLQPVIMLTMHRDWTCHPAHNSPPSPVISNRREHQTWRNTLFPADRHAICYHVPPDRQISIKGGWVRTSDYTPESARCGQHAKNRTHPDTQQKGDIHQMLVWCWATDCDGGSRPNHH